MSSGGRSLPDKEMKHGFDSLGAYHLWTSSVTVAPWAFTPVGQGSNPWESTRVVARGASWKVAPSNRPGPWLTVDQTPISGSGPLLYTEGGSARHRVGVPWWPNPNGAEAVCETVVRGFDSPRSPHLNVVSSNGKAPGS
jgi:hypothetical protein